MKRTVLEKDELLAGRIAVSEFRRSTIVPISFSEIEFSVFSQWGDDGIIQRLIQCLDFPNKTFVEFGVEDYTESNTRFLLMNNNWSGLIIDGSPKNIDSIRRSPYFWRYDLTATLSFVTAENIQETVSGWTYGDTVDLLHIDLDGNDYWIWDALEIRPVVVVLEYNSLFGSERAVTVPYRPDFDRSKAHWSNLYFGASLPALYDLTTQRGYEFIGCNSAGNNAYFVRQDRMTKGVASLGLKDGFVSSKFREGLTSDGNLSLIGAHLREVALAGLPVWDTRLKALTRL